MRKVIIFILFIIIIFIINVTFYFLSEDYRFFLKTLKGNNVIDLQEKSFNDKIIDDKIFDEEFVKKSNKNDEIFIEKNNSWHKELKEEITLWKNYIDIINLFSIYDIKKLEINSNLFDLTDEYPDNYFEYYSKDLTLYLLPTKNYTEVYDIFSVLSDELPFKLKEVNNFGDKSFFINLNSDIDDRFTRIVITNKWVVFWLKMKKTEYDLVKEKLKSLKSE